jgi:hypothetical protein
MSNQFEESATKTHITGNVVWISERMKKRSKPADVIRWGAYRLRSKAEKLGTFEAKNDPAVARRVAIERFEIPEPEQFRISVQREPVGADG